MQMSLSLHTLVIRTFVSVEAKDLDGTMSLFAEDGGHHPKDSWRRSAASHSFGYMTVNYLESADGQCAAVETATHHVVTTGINPNFPQMFVFEVADGRIKRMQAYAPYGAHGLMGFFLFLSRLTTLWRRT